MRIVSLIFFFFAFAVLQAQKSVSIQVLENNQSKVVDSLINESSEKFIFFCPTYNASVESYKRVIKIFEGQLDSGFNKSVDIHFILFREDPVNPSKGILIRSNETKLPYAISDLEVYYVNEDLGRANRSYRLYKKDYLFSRRFNDKNYYHLDLNIKACFRTLPDHLPAYLDFINEVIEPKYTDKERIYQLSDSLQMMVDKNVFLENNLERLQANLDCLEDRLNRTEVLLDTLHSSEILGFEGDFYQEPIGTYELPKKNAKIKHSPLKIAAFLSPFVVMTTIILSLR